MSDYSLDSRTWMPSGAWHDPFMLEEDWVMAALDELDLEVEAQALANGAIKPENVAIAIEMLDVVAQYPSVQGLLVDGRVRPGVYFPWEYHPLPEEKAYTYFPSLSNLAANHARIFSLEK